MFFLLALLKDNSRWARLIVFYLEGLLKEETDSPSYPNLSNIVASLLVVIRDPKLNVKEAKLSCILI